MRRLIVLLALPLAGCIPIVAGVAAGRAAARDEVRRAGPLDDSGEMMVGLVIGEDLKVTSVESGGPAEAAGVRPGDLVVEVDGYGIEHRQQALNYLHGQAGKKVWLDVSREDKLITVRLQRRCLPQLGCAKSVARKDPRQAMEESIRP
jgi:predicted metalloprotease with PDZ domain